jgi:hypothetical protein
MPKKMSRNKRGKTPMRSRTGLISPRVHSVKDLLARRAPGLMRITAQSARQNFWSCWLSERLSPELRAKVSGITESAGTLVIFAETAAWSARLRYAVLELEHEIRAADPAVIEVKVRVLPAQLNRS